MIRSSSIPPFDKGQRTLNKTVFENEVLLSGAFWEELRVFLAVAKAKSFNRGAEILGMSQPTVSRRVKRLQDMMGTQLFVSTQQGVRLTQSGEEVANACAHLDHLLFSLRNDLRADAAQDAAVVRISITDGLAALFIAPALAAFTAAHPRIQVHLKSPDSLVSLRDNSTDMMLSFMPSGPPELTVQPAGVLHFVPFASKSYIEAHGLPTRQNAEDHAFIQSELYTAKTGIWDAWLRIVARGQISHFCDNSFAYGALAKSGSGIALLGNYNALEPTAVPLELDVEIGVPMTIVALTERLRSRPVQIVFDWLTRIFGTGNPWFASDLRMRSYDAQSDAGFKQLFNLREGDLLASAG